MGFIFSATDSRVFAKKDLASLEGLLANSSSTAAISLILLLAFSENASSIFFRDALAFWASSNVSSNRDLEPPEFPEVWGAGFQSLIGSNFLFQSSDPGLRLVLLAVFIGSSLQKILLIRYRSAIESMGKIS